MHAYFFEKNKLLLTNIHIYYIQVFINELLLQKYSDFNFFKTKI